MGHPVVHRVQGEIEHKGGSEQCREGGELCLEKGKVFRIEIENKPRTLCYYTGLCIHCIYIFTFFLKMFVK